MSIVKSLTKKNCKEIGAEHVGANRFKGIGYLYKGIIFNQYISRKCGTLIYIQGINLYSDLVQVALKQVSSSFGWRREIDLSELTTWMDSVVDSIKSASMKEQTPISEEEKIQFCKEIESSKEQVKSLLEQMKQSFRWWEDHEDTNWILCRFETIKDKEKELDSLIERLNTEKDILIQRKISLDISETLEEIQCWLGFINPIIVKHS